MAKREREGDTINDLCRGVKRLHPMLSEVPGIPSADDVCNRENIGPKFSNSQKKDDTNAALYTYLENEDEKKGQMQSMYSDINAFLWQLHNERIARQNSQAKPEKQPSQ